ncbi:lactonase family protein [Halomonas sp. PR-M31]|uniref:lactonase family protein n=1 Tax=Halomonas sp. PR-M31 TaxID=1471202 RepID=UPI0009E49EE7|nr:lactonase family protein [Halomonas sp. PR-M31]
MTMHTSTYRKPYRGFLTALALASLMSLGAQAGESEQMLEQNHTLLIGTYTDDQLYLPSNTYQETGHSKGVYRVQLDAQGKFTVKSTTPVVSPSWLVVGPKGHYVYATNEASGHSPGQVSALMVDPDSGVLHLINQRPSHGWQPAHAALSPDGRYLLVANYSVDAGHSGVSVFPIADNGALEEMTQYLGYEGGSGGVADRQASSHAHSVNFSPDGTQVFVADLGADRLYAYRYRPEADKPLIEDDAATVEFQKGSGPRHMVFDESGEHAYVVTEMGARVHLFDYQKGRLEQRKSWALTAAQDQDAKAGGGLGLSPDGQFLYVSNRGTRNEIVAYRVDAEDGSLSEVGHTSVNGKEPRALLVGSDHVLVTNQHSNQVVEFARNAKTGALRATGHVLDIASPSDVKRLSKNED